MSGKRALFLWVLASCPSLGPLKIICRDDLDCPSPSRCVAGFCSEEQGGGGGSGAGTAGGTAVGGGSGGGLGFCASLNPRPKFCADFDEPDADVDFMRWNGHSTADAGYVALDTQQFASAPRAMRATLAANSGGCRFAIASAYLETDGGPQKARLALSGRWPDGGWTGPFAQLGLERFGTNGGLCQGILSAQSGELIVLEQGFDEGGANPYSHNHATGFDLPRDTYVRLELEYDVQGRRILLWMDGGLILDAGFQMNCPYVPATRIAIAAGFWCTPTQAATRHVWFDDVTLDFQ